MTGRSVRRGVRRALPPALAVLVAAVSALASPSIEPPAPDVFRRVLEGARLQIGKTVSYDGAYRVIGYPGGDVPPDRGVCTDVVIRAYRHAGVDLQVLVHEDMERAFSLYPRQWGLSKPDANIDHRRVPNLATFLRRHGAVLPASTDSANYRPGDIVTWKLSSGVPHVGIVSDRTAGSARVPMVVHNIGEGAREEAVLFQYEITGHFRYLPAADAGRAAIRR